MSAIELATGYVALIPSARGIGAALTSELGAPVEKAASDAGTKASAGFKSKFNSGVKGIGKGISEGVLAGVAGTAAVGGVILKLGTDFKEASNTIRTATGATGPALVGLNKDMDAVFASRPDSLKDVSSAIAQLHVGLGTTGPALQAVAKQVLELSDITHTDLSTNLQAAVHVLNNFGISAKQQPAALNELFRASQATGTSVSDLAASMAKMGSPLRQLGFSFTDSAALLGLLGKSGVNTATVMPALSKSIAAAAKEGKSAGTVFRDTFNAIKNAPNDTIAAGDAITLFGARAGPNLSGLIRQGKLSYQQLSATIANGGDTIQKATDQTEGFGDKFKTFTHNLEVPFAPLAVSGINFAISELTKATPFLTKFATNVQTALGRVGPQIQSLFANIASAVGPVLKDLVGSVGKIDFGAIFAKAKAAILPLLPPFERLYASIVKLNIAALPVLKSGIELVLGAAIKLRPVFVAVLNVITGVIGSLTTHMSALKPVLLGAAAAFAAFKTAKAVKGVFDSIVVSVKGTVAAVGKARTAVTGFFKSAGALKDTVGTKLTGIKDAASKVGSALKSAGSAVLSWGKSALAAAASGAKTAAAFVAEKVAALASAAADKITAAAQWLLNAAMDANPITLIIIAIAALVAGIIIAYKNFAPFRNVVDAVGRALAGMAKAILGAVTGAFDWIKSHWPLLLAILTGPFGLAVLVISKHWASIKAGFTAVKNWIGDRIKDIVNFFIGLPGRIGGAAKGLWSSIVNGITTARNWVHDRIWDVIGFVKNLPSEISKAASGMWDGIKDAFKATINGIADIWNNTIGSLSFHLPSWIPGIGGDGFSMPKIPHLANGGVATSPVLALLGETSKARPEIVAPATMLREIFRSELGNFKPFTLSPAEIPAPQAAPANLDHLRDFDTARDAAGPLVHQENHFHDAKLAKADLDYAGTQAAWRVRNTGRRS